MPSSIIIRPILLPPAAAAAAAHRLLLLSRQAFQISSFLLPCLHHPRQQNQQQQQQQKRAASILSNLSDNPGAYNKKIRRGRGPSSGKGKTSGRGHKGQKQHGKVPFGFNGGQTKDEDTNPIRGLNNRTANFVVDMTPLNLDRVQNWINQGRIDPSRPITIKELGDSRCINPSKVGDGIKLLAGGADKISHPLNIVVSRASKAAIGAVESAGGSVLTRYYTPFSIRRIMQGKTDPINSLQSQAPSATATATTAAVMRMPRFTFSSSSSSSSSSSTTGAAAAAADVVVEPRSESENEWAQKERGEEEGMIGQKEEGQKLAVWQNRLPDPVSRKAIEYYRDPAHRGYLSYQVGQGQGPSLFFKTPRPPPAAAAAGGELAFASASNDSTTTTSSATTTTSIKSSKKGQAAANRIW